MVYLLGVVAVAMRCTRRISVMISFVSVAAFDFFCVPPYLAFQVADYQYVITFVGMLAAALVISTQTNRIRQQATDAQEREARTDALYTLSRRLAAQDRISDLARSAGEYAEEVFETPTTIFLPENGVITFKHRSLVHLPTPIAECIVAQWVFEHGEKGGHGTNVHSGSSALYLPLRGTKEIVGIMSLLPPQEGFPTGRQLQFLEVFAHQIALAIERIASQDAAEAARLKMQTEEMRSSLLSVVSHDLRTPLASITGAVSTLRWQREKLEPATRDELLESIADEAERLSRLVGNLLDMTRLQSGVELRRDRYPVEDIVGTTLQRLERQIGRRHVITDLPDNLPLIHADEVLLGQALVNLLENAIKYTPEDTPIEIAAGTAENVIWLEVRDRGPGFGPGEEQRIFERFYRGRSKEVHGAGLGLAICRAVIQAHHGTIEAFNRSSGGAIFRILLPREET